MKRPKHHQHKSGANECDQIHLWLLLVATVAGTHKCIAHIGCNDHVDFGDDHDYASCIFIPSHRGRDYQQADEPGQLNQALRIQAQGEPMNYISLEKNVRTMNPPP